MWANSSIWTTKHILITASMFEMCCFNWQEIVLGGGGSEATATASPGPIFCNVSSTYQHHINAYSLNVGVCVFKTVHCWNIRACVSFTESGVRTEERRGGKECGRRSR